MILKLLGSLVEPTDRYKNTAHRLFAKVLTAVIKVIVGSITPASFICLAYLLFNYQSYAILNLPVWMWNRSQWTLIALTFWSLLEIGFFLHCLNLKRQFSAKSTTEQLTWPERSYHLQRILDHNPAPFISLSKWFHKNDPAHVTVEHVEDWLAWAFFSKLRSELNDEERIELSALVNKCLERDKSLVRTGNYENPLPFMKLNLDPIRFQHKPIVAYLVIGAMQQYGVAFLAFTGFKHYNCEPASTLSYWIYNEHNLRSSNSSTNNNTGTGTVNNPKPPVFLVYGIGIGVTMYLKVINAIRTKDPSRTIVVLDLPHISLKLVTDIPSMNQTLTAIDSIFKKHELRACNWFGHSYGSIVTAWVIKQRPEYILRVSLVDPVCFALWEPDLIRNFLYKPTSCRGPIHHLAQFFVAKDLLVASTLFRNFWWLQNILFPEDCPYPTHIYFSKYDWIINSQIILEYLQECKRRQPQLELSAEMMDNVAHGGFISNDEKIAIVLKHV